MAGRFQVHIYYIIPGLFTENNTSNDRMIYFRDVMICNLSRLRGLLWLPHWNVRGRSNVT